MPLHILYKNNEYYSECKFLCCRLFVCLFVFCIPRLTSHIPPLLLPECICKCTEKNTPLHLHHRMFRGKQTPTHTVETAVEITGHEVMESFAALISLAVYDATYVARVRTALLASNEHRCLCLFVWRVLFFFFFAHLYPYFPAGCLFFPQKCPVTNV